jgi:phage baseplate assembly protein W
MTQNGSGEIVGQGWAFPPRISPRGGLALTGDRNEIDEAITIILSTSPGQRVMRTHFGCRLQELVFAPNNRQTAAQARRFVEDALGMWEPRISLQRVDVRPDPQDTHCLRIEIAYEVKSTHDRRSLVYPFYLIPAEG